MAQRLDLLRQQLEAASLTLNELARRATVSVWLLRQLEDGGDCTGDESQRIADALGVTLTALGKQDL